MDQELIAARVDRLPLAAMHWRLLALLAIPLFFDEADITTLPAAAPGMVRFWHIGINQVAQVTSASFLGMFLGAIIGGALSDRLGA